MTIKLLTFVFTFTATLLPEYLIDRTAGGLAKPRLIFAHSLNIENCQFDFLKSKTKLEYIRNVRRLILFLPPAERPNGLELTCVVTFQRAGIRF